MPGRRRNAVRAVLLSPSGIAAVVLFAGFLFLAVAGSVIWGADAQRLAVSEASQGPSLKHLLGTDMLGRDVLARTLAATRLSLELALAAAGIGAGIGLPIGTTVGVLGRRAQRLVGHLINLGMMFPPILVALFLVTVIGPGQLGATLAIGLALAPSFARTAQTLAASVGNSDYVDAARVIGVRRPRLLFRYVVPNTADSLILQAAGSASIALVAVAALSFLGLGVQPPAFDWGQMLAQGLQGIYVTPIAALAPGAAIILAGLMFNFLGDAAARALEPSVRVMAAARGDDGAGAESEPHPAGARSLGREALDRPERTPVVRIDDLHVRFPRGRRSLEALAGVSLEIAPGEVVGVVGESGSGKTMLSLAIAGLVPYPGETSARRLELLGEDVSTLSRRERSRLLGTRLGIIFQDPMSSLNPALRVGRQVGEKLVVHQGDGWGTALGEAKQRLAEVHIPAPEARAGQYPHEYSGGMRQRAMIAMGLITNPALIIADEPTTALDVTVQSQILDLLREVNATHETAILLISHDIAVVSELCSRVIVMYAGRIVEVLDAEHLAEDAVHPYTHALIESVVDLDADRAADLATIPGVPPGLDSRPPGCPFAPRCPLAIDRCHEQEPALEPIGRARSVACWVAASEAAV